MAEQFWTEGVFPPDNSVPYYSVNAIAGNGNAICAVGRYYAATSTDGVNWSFGSIPIQTGGKQWRWLCWNGAVFCAISDSGV